MDKTHILEEDRGSKTLEISYSEFLSVLKEWDKYLKVHVYRTKHLGGRANYFESRDPEDNGFDAYDRYRDEFSDEKKLVEIAHLLWNSLKSGSVGVEEIHASEFADYQVEQFRDNYVGNPKYPSDEGRFFNSHLRNYGPIVDPVRSFANLGSVAQTRIVNDGLLKRAIANYEKFEERRKESNRLRRFVQKSTRENKKCGGQ